MSRRQPLISWSHERQRCPEGALIAENADVTLTDHTQPEHEFKLLIVYIFTTAVGDGRHGALSVIF